MHPLKAWLPIDFTLFWMSICFSFVHLSKANCPISLRLFPRKVKVEMGDSSRWVTDIVLYRWWYLFIVVYCMFSISSLSFHFFLRNIQKVYPFPSRGYPVLDWRHGIFRRAVHFQRCRPDINHLCRQRMRVESFVWRCGLYIHRFQGQTWGV